VRTAGRSSPDRDSVGSTGYRHDGDLAFLLGWNEFLFSLILAGPESRTLAGDDRRLRDRSRHPLGQFSAAAVSIMLPVIAIALVLQRHIVKGLTDGSRQGLTPSRR